MGQYLAHRHTKVRKRTAVDFLPTPEALAAARREREGWDTMVAVRRLELADKERRLIEHAEKKRNEREERERAIALKALAREKALSELEEWRQLCTDGLPYYPVKTRELENIFTPTFRFWKDTKIKLKRSDIELMNIVYYFTFSFPNPTIRMAYNGVLIRDKQLYPTPASRRAARTALRIAVKCGLFNNKTSIRYFIRHCLKTIRLYKHRIEVSVLSETWIDPDGNFIPTKNSKLNIHKGEMS